MTVSAPLTAPRVDARFIETLRKRYEDRGFTFVVNPPSELIPSFLPFEPDAIAQKPGKNIVVEVVTPQSTLDSRSVVELRRHIAGHPDWSLDVAYVRADEPPISIPSADAPAVRRWVEEAAALGAAGQTRAAFLLAWSLLEASLHTASAKSFNPPRKPSQVVEWLAMNGDLVPEQEPPLLALAALRERLAHGDLSVDATREDIDFVLSVVGDTLAMAA